MTRRTSECWQRSRLPRPFLSDGHWALTSAVPTPPLRGSNPEGVIPSDQTHCKMKAHQRFHRSGKYVALQRKDTGTQSEKNKQMNWVIHFHQLLTVRTQHLTELGVNKWRLNGKRQGVWTQGVSCPLKENTRRTAPKEMRAIVLADALKREHP